MNIVEFAEGDKFLGLKLYDTQKELLTEFFSVDEKGSRKYNELILLSGKGSGKDFLSSIIMCYCLYELLELPNPQAFYGLAPGENIDLINVATTADQASSVFFAKLRSRIEFSPYFQKKNPSIGRNRIEFPNHIVCFSANSRNETYEGKNIFCGILDEASAFSLSGLKGNSFAIYQTLYTSMSSRFPENGLICVLSYPRRSVDDFTVDLFEQKKGKPRVLARKYKTWELNKGISREQLQPFYDYDFAAAKKMYECEIVSTSVNKYDVTLLKEAQAALEPLLYSKQSVSMKGERSYTARLLEKVRSVKDVSFLIAIDTGLKGSNLAMSIGHVEQGQVVIDQVVQWRPTSTVEVDMENVFEFIMEFARVNRVSAIWLDQWNSALLNQMLRSAGLDSRTLNFSGQLKWKMYEKFNVLLRIGDLVLPEDDDVVRDFSQIEQLTEGSVNNKTDLTDSVALCVLKLSEKLEDKKVARKKKPRVLIR